MRDTPIEAAGGLVIRPDENGELRVLVVHRPRYDDWSLPKGKAEPGESPAQTAVREVEEETGVRAEVISPLAEIEYTVPSGRRKVVRYFVMRPRSVSPFEPTTEVDEVRWLRPDTATGLLSYEHDRSLLSADLKLLASTGTVRLIRHAAAGDRSNWEDEDLLRPLSKKGRRQAAAIATALAAQPVDAVYSSPYVRCRDTVQPLAEERGLTVEDSDHLAEGADDAATLEWLLGMTGKSVVACSHGDVIPGVIRLLDAAGVRLDDVTGELAAEKGSTWTLAVAEDRVTSAVYTPPPKV